MASGFIPEYDTKCAGCKTEGKAHVTYRIECKETFCDECVVEKQGQIKEVLTKVVSCENHVTKDAKVFCESHEIIVCMECAFVSHQSPCETKDIGDKISERKDAVLDLSSRGGAKQEELKRCSEIMHEGMARANQYLTAISERIVDAARNAKMKINTEEKYMAAHINHEANEEMERIRLKRNESLEELEQNINNKLEHVENEERIIQGDLSRVKAKLQERWDGNVGNLRELSSNLDEMLTVITLLLTEEKALLNDFQRATRSILDALHAEVNMKTIDDLVSVTEKIALEEEEDRVIGRLNLPNETWELDDKFATGLGIESDMIGSLGKDEVLIKCFDKNSMHITNLHDRTSKTVHRARKSSMEDIFSCVVMDDGRIVCGTHEGKIVVYNHEWNIIKTIRVERRSGFPIRVRIDMDGMIVATANRDNTIQIYNLDEGKIIRSIVTNNIPLYEISTMSSGKFAVLTECSLGPDVCVLDEMGVGVSCTHFHGKDVRNLAVDRSRDSIYALLLDEERGLCVVNVMSSDEVIGAQNISETKPFFLTCAILEPGKLVIHNGDEVLIFKKTSLGLDELLGFSCCQELL